MPPRRPDSEPTDLSQHFDFGEGEHLARISPAFATACLGGISLLVSGAAWLPSLAWVAWIDLPLTFLAFLIAAWTSLTDQRETARALPGLLACALAVTSSAVHLFISPAHPWVG